MRLIERDGPAWPRIRIYGLHELVSLPRGSYVHPNGQGPSGDLSITVHIADVSKEADLDVVMQALARKIQLQRLQSA